MKSRTLLVIAAFATVSWLGLAEFLSAEPSPAAVSSRVENRAGPPHEADPFAADGGRFAGLNIPAGKRTEPRTTLMLRVETWESGARDAVVLLDSAKAAEIGEKARNSLAANPSAKLIHSFALTLDERGEAVSEGIVEQIYPTEYEPPALPAVPAAPPADPKSEIARAVERMIGAACPSAFDTRNTGATLTVQVQPVEAERGCWDLAVQLETVLWVGAEPVGAVPFDMKMPVFSTFRLDTAVRLGEARWQLLGMASPPRGRVAEPADRRWLTFVRVERAR